MITWANVGTDLYVQMASPLLVNVLKSGFYINQGKHFFGKKQDIVIHKL